jgi:hypothetical protein
MSRYRNFSWLPLVALLLLFGAAPAMADFTEQCPPDTDGIDTDGDGTVDNDHYCIQVGAGDGFSVMADGYPQYMFGFSDYGGKKNAGGDAGTAAEPRLDPAYMGNPWDAPVNPGNMLGANFPSPGIEMNQGQILYLTLSNVGMLMRPDLFDPHTIHGHGFSEAASIFDGVPEYGIMVNMGASFTYFYNLFEPGTLAYHCHVEASEHMQMGMLAQFWVNPIQNNLPDLTDLNGFTHNTGNKYAYNDEDGATFYDVAYGLQLHSFDPDFHDASLAVQPLPFALMNDRYPMINGRGYPDTVNPGNLTNGEGFEAQNLSAVVTATAGDRILLRLSSMVTTGTHTLMIPGMTMTVVGTDSRMLRTAGDPDPAGRTFIYNTNSVDIPGGLTRDVILDTRGEDGLLGTPDDVAPGTYFLYATNLNMLSNFNEDYGGMMTEIVINP